jgi:hypothetical protein
MVASTIALCLQDHIFVVVLVSLWLSASIPCSIGSWCGRIIIATVLLLFPGTAATIYRSPLVVVVGVLVR